MKKIVIPNTFKQIKDLINITDGFLIGIDDLSINMKSFSLEETLEIINYLKQNNKEIFVSLNKNMHRNDLKKLEETLILLDNLKINGICFYDISIVNIKKRLNLKTDLVWSAEHLTTNYNTINYWYNEGVNYTYLSSEITLKEILEIKNNTKAKLFVNVFGYLPMYTSYRNVIKNYIDCFNLDEQVRDINYIEKENHIYPVVSKNGTTIYSSNIFEALQESIELKNIDYFIFNSFNIDESKFKRIIEMFECVSEANKKELEREIYEMFPNVDKGFLYKETVFKVKKND